MIRTFESTSLTMVPRQVHICPVLGDFVEFVLLTARRRIVRLAAKHPKPLVISAGLVAIG